LGLGAGDNAPNVWGWVDPLGLSCKEQANVHVAYHPNKPVGHNVIGIELPNEQTQWYDLVMTENPGGTTGLMKGGQGTTLRKQLNLSSKYKISTNINTIGADTREFSRGVLGPPWKIS